MDEKQQVKSSNVKKMIIHDDQELKIDLTLESIAIIHHINRIKRKKAVWPPENMQQSYLKEFITHSLHA